MQLRYEDAGYHVEDLNQREAGFSLSDPPSRHPRITGPWPDQEAD